MAVPLSQIKAANASIKTKHESVTAVFTGATSGIGRATLQAFARYIPCPKAIIIGRSHTAFEAELANLRTINPNGEYVFLEADVSSLKSVDALTERIRAELKADQKIDFLGMSQGYLPLTGRMENAEGLENSSAVRHYGRILLLQNLLQADLFSRDAKVLSVMAGTQEGSIVEDDLELKKSGNFGVGKVNAHITTLHTLSLDALAAKYPHIAFLHTFPGLVSTGLLGRHTPGVLGWLFRWVVDPILGIFAGTPEESGQRHFSYVFGDEDRREGEVRLLNEKGESKETEELKGYREIGYGQKVVKHNEEVFARVLVQEISAL